MSDAEVTMPPRPTLTVFFRSGGERYSLPASAIHKVADVEYVHRLAGLPAGVLGISHHHGHVVTVIELEGALLGELPSKTRLSPRLLVLEQPAKHLALMVDVVEEIREFRPVAAPSHDSLWGEESHE
ncbi:MAG: chemotaxis protein CheW, partial [Myxococcota bacterium]